jgi:D-alanyl-D-alanine carboxypeptidase (penicillin-binding protein 5/6)
MITALLSIYAAGTLAFGNTAAVSPHTMPWNDQTTLEATPIPERDPLQIAPVIKAKAAIAVDLKNGLILYEKNIHDPLPIASLTKLMTAVIVLEDTDLKETAKISRTAAKTEGSKIWLAQDEKITVENLLYAALINSANDAAMALAEHHSGNSDEFVKKMNIRAGQLGMIATNFVNPTGLNQDPSDTQETAVNDAPDQPVLPALPPIISAEKSVSDTKNISTAYDLTLLARYAYGKSFVRRAVVKKEYEVSSVNGVTVHKLKNTNELLDSYLKVLGLKTGTTDEAGECLIAIIENEEGHDILTVVLNSPARYSETKLLADWVFKAYKWN